MAGPASHSMDCFASERAKPDDEKAFMSDQSLTTQRFHADFGGTYKASLLPERWADGTG